jgi:hypothetical protein
MEIKKIPFLIKTKNSTVFQKSGTKVANQKRKEFLTAKSLEQIIFIKLAISGMKMAHRL